MALIREAIYDVCEEQNPLTIRGLFYALVSAGVVAKTEGEYKSTVVRLAGEMRRAGDLPWHWVADHTRWMRKPRSYGTIEEAIAETAALYRRDVWTSMPERVEVWLEKDALAGVVYDVTEEWDVPLMVTRGYASLSFLHSAAAEISAIGKPTYIYFLGDLDPSGKDIPRAVERDLREMAPDVTFYFERLAVNAEQIDLYDLPTRPTKKTDSRAKNFDGRSVELDAIPAPTLRDLVDTAIRRHIDEDVFGALQVAERDERRLAGRLVGMLREAS